jgi:hypothetical protein
MCGHFLYCFFSSITVAASQQQQQRCHCIIHMLLGCMLRVNQELNSKVNMGAKAVMAVFAWCTLPYRQVVQAGTGGCNRHVHIGEGGGVQGLSNLQDYWISWVMVPRLPPWCLVRWDLTLTAVGFKLTLAG